MSQSVESVLQKASLALAQVAERPMHEAQILLSFHLQKEILWLITHPDSVVEHYSDYFALVKRRALHEPIEYITASVSFYSQNFYIAKGALIPRPETELLVDEVLACVDEDYEGHIVEIGVGSGVITIMLALHLKKARFSAIDISKEALEVAKLNVAKFSLEDRIKLFEGNLLEPIKEDIDMIVSNPPYIQKGICLDKNLSYEPQEALFGGQKGDEILKEIIDLAKIADVDALFCEMGYDQRQSIEDYVKDMSEYTMRFYKDLAEFDRGFIMRKKG